MGGCASAPAAKPQPRASSTGESDDYPEDGKKLRRDVTLEEVYELGATLGEGGYSKVKLATDRVTGEQWACKIIPLPRPGKRVNEHMSDRAAIMKEIDVLLDLDHPHVVGLQEYFVWRNRVYLIMELLQGGELLEAVLDQGHYSEADARTIFRQLIDAVQYLHTRGVVHRDVKLDNLLLVHPKDISNVKIADFGFAKKQPGGALDSMRTVCGTPGYIAPEVIRGIMHPSGAPSDKDDLNKYGPPCDLWSAGIVLYILLAGVPPFHDPSEPRMLRAIMGGKYDFNDSVWKPVSAEAKHLISRLLVVDPAQRYTCTQVLEHPWMTAALPAGEDAALPGARARMAVAITRRRSSQQLTLQRRISQAISASSARTPLGGSPEGTSPRGGSPPRGTAAAAAGAVAAAWGAPVEPAAAAAAMDTRAAAGWGAALPVGAAASSSAGGGGGEEARQEGGKGGSMGGSSPKESSP